MCYSFDSRHGGRFFALALVSITLLLLAVSPPLATAQEGENRLLSIGMDKEGTQPTVVINTQDPVGYRYTVYDSLDPVRVVLDFPGMDVFSIETPIRVDALPLQEIRVSSFDLSSGKLGRVELLLSSAANYEVILSGNDFRVSFAEAVAPAVSAEKVSEQVPESASTEGVEVVEEGGVGAQEAAESVPESPVEVEAAGAVPAGLVSRVELHDGQALLVTDGRIGKYRYFRLSAPPRLVVDVYGVQPEFKERSFPASLGFREMRIGTYKDKTRFVFDSEADALPEYAVSEQGNAIAVSWGAGVSPVAEPVSATVGVPVAVEAVDFQTENGNSVLSISLSGPAEIVAASAEGDVVRFGIRNATISRALRRSVDTSVFPSAVRLVTPYTVQVGESQDVRFAAELKGPVPYDLRQEGNKVLFVVEDGSFAEVAPAPLEKVEVPVAVPVQPLTPTPAAVDTEKDVRVSDADAPVMPSVTVGEEKAYTGEKITLVFDDADIRRIFQLIGEVSDLNVIVGDEVQGAITLRLIDVPWDQALDLILDIKNLGMLWEGNVVRILPRDVIRAMRQAELTAVKEERELEPLVTEVVSVSYTDLGNITGPAGELLSDRGKITPDNRNKQLIVTDIPAVIEEVKKLVAILDTPEKQVMIEARIVEASEDFTRDLGVSWNLSYSKDDFDSNEDVLSSGDIGGGGAFNISPLSTIPGGLGSSFTFGKLGVTSSVLDLRISAAEFVSQVKVLSKPRVTTLNGETATISQGTTIPYQSVSDEGTQTEFVDATLELSVTPIVNPDDSIILEVKTSKNSPVVVAGATAPGIDKNEATTKVLVRNGETTVIGGIFTEDETKSETGIPLLRSLPIVGHLFKSTNRTEIRSELLIFITPRILE